MVLYRIKSNYRKYWKGISKLVVKLLVIFELIFHFVVLYRVPVQAQKDPTFLCKTNQYPPSWSTNSFIYGNDEAGSTPWDSPKLIVDINIVQSIINFLYSNLWNSEILNIPSDVLTYFLKHFFFVEKSM